MADITEAEAQLYDRQVSQIIQYFLDISKPKSVNFHENKSSKKIRQIETFTS